MAFLLIAGVEYDVIDIAEGEPESIGGEVVRTESGALRSTVRAERRNWSLALNDMSESAYRALAASVALGKAVALSGDMLAVIGVRNVVVTLRGCAYVRDGTGFLRQPSLDAREA